MGRLDALREWKFIFGLMIDHIHYENATLPECCMGVSRMLPQPYKECFSAIQVRMDGEEGEDFATVYQREISKLLSQLPLSTEERELVENVIGDAVCPQEDMQVAYLERGVEMLGHRIGMQEKDIRVKCKLAVELGLLGGLFMVMILL